MTGELEHPSNNPRGNIMQGLNNMALAIMTNQKDFQKAASDIQNSFVVVDKWSREVENQFSLIDISLTELANLVSVPVRTTQILEQLNDQVSRIETQVKSIKNEEVVHGLNSFGEIHLTSGQRFLKHEDLLASLTSRLHKLEEGAHNRFERLEKELFEIKEDNQRLHNTNKQREDWLNDLDTRITELSEILYRNKEMGFNQSAN